MEAQQLQNRSLPELKEARANLLKRKSELESLKAKGGKQNPEVQNELSEVNNQLSMVEEAILDKELSGEEATESAVEGATESAVEGETEHGDKLVRLKLVKGARFNPYTGEEMAKPYKQAFTYSEWLLFKGNFKRLGITITEVISDPWGEAKDYVTKNEEKNADGRND